MKNISVYITILLVCISNLALAQLEGRKFISGNVGLSFSNYKPEQSKSTNSYGYNVNLNLGKFRTNSMASGWNVLSSLSGGTDYLTNSQVEITGLKGFSVGAGHFWQFYKHFGSKYGIYGGPNLSLVYSYVKKTEVQAEDITHTKDHAVAFTMGASAGAYYAFSERWWLLGTIGFSDFLGVKYTTGTSSYDQGQETQTKHEIQYGFAPYINFPSVSLGLRYFLRN